MIDQIRKIIHDRETKAFEGGFQRVDQRDYDLDMYKYLNHDF